MAQREFRPSAIDVASPLKYLQDAARALGLREVPASALDLADATAKGLPSTTLTKLSFAIGVTRSDLVKELGIAPRTAARLDRKRILSSPQSERVLRLARAFTRAADVLESPVSAKRWLLEPNAALGGRRPASLLSTDVGTELVLNELGKIDHGFFA